MNAITGALPVVTPFDHPEFSGHENIVFVRDEASGLFAIIAVHDTRLGPGLGGCRIWPYKSASEALTDALRLSRGMTYKNALAGLDLGGGKAVIIADPRKDKTSAMMEAFGAHVDRLNGTYITAEDVGVSAADMENVARQTAHVRGTTATGLGDPSPYTALGVFAGIRAAAYHAFGSRDLKGKTVSLQGLGHVGFGLAELLNEAGAKLIVSDISQNAVSRAIGAFDAVAIGPEDAHRVGADIYAPCALGAAINHRTVPEIKAPIVAGAANNQLETPADGFALKARGILYAPDYAINAGGVISIAVAKPGEGDVEVRQKVLAIEETLTRIFERADAEDRTPEQVADLIAEERLGNA